MPKSSLMGLRWVLAPAAAIVAAAACCSPAGAVVGGKRAIDGDPPTGPLNYQVALIRNDRPSDGRRAILRGLGPHRRGRPSQHIVTAAHCVFDNSATAPGQPIAPAEPRRPRRDDEARDRRRPPTARRRRLDRSRPTIPRRSAHDAAVLTLTAARARRHGRPADRLRRPTTVGAAARGTAPWSAAGAGSTAAPTRPICAGPRCRSRPTPAAIELGRGGHRHVDHGVRRPARNGLVLRRQRWAARQPTTT